MYICECGKEFDKSQSFNGHKSHCKIHQLHKYGEEHYLKNLEKLNTNWPKATQAYVDNCKKRADEKLDNWILEQHCCEKCGKIMTEKYGSGRFCSRTCANSRYHSEETKEKITASVVKYHEENKKSSAFRKKYPNCVICGKELPEITNKTRRKTCSAECLSKLWSSNGVIGGRSSAVAENRRSRNEIYFCELCEDYFSAVKHNEPVFNGWDADVIIEDYKIAVLWNGIWHYKKVRKIHSVEQVEARDKIKLDQIKSCGYTPYVIKDLGRYNKRFVEEQFNVFLDFFKLKHT